MSNAKIISLVAESYRQTRVEAQRDVNSALCVTEDELLDIRGNVVQLEQRIVDLENALLHLVDEIKSLRREGSVSL